MTVGPVHVIRNDEDLDRAHEWGLEIMLSDDPAERAKFAALDALIVEYLAEHPPPPPEGFQLRPTEVEPREGYRIWVKFSDGVEGEVDLSHLEGRGVFKAWEDRNFFEQVHIMEGKFVAWNEELDFCTSALYMKVTGLSVDEFDAMSANA